MIGSDFLLALAAHLAWMEGKDHGPNGPIAILFCLRNRVAAGWEDGNLGRIIQSGSYLKSESRKSIWWMEVPDTRNPEVQQFLSYVEGVFDNSIRDVITNGALFWGQEKPLGATERVAQVGTLSLWK